MVEGRISMNPNWDTMWLGRVPYDDAWALQDRLAQEIAAGMRPPTLLLLEHPHIYTLGRRGQVCNLLWDEAERVARGVEIRWVDRGGDITYHGPGQLVGYPLLPLAEQGWTGERLPQTDYVGYVRRLEASLITALGALGVAAGQREGLTGVWIPSSVWARCLRCDPALRAQPAKIASIGVKVDARGVSRHGFALNVDTDMAYWEGIHPCGLEQVQMANLDDFLSPPRSMAQIREAVWRGFEEVFGCTLRLVDRLQV
jgi:lipoate-protein ligase B